ncbi:hypothetical protein D9611_006659 [Ephemerocybe angulata]|uniref:Uncharacterized protein n=1 Tax=Ephemerocybe angulata TaxID=980116 RepID=A0A8H5FGW3_9AGAR|nr:hypothetical protein D9611_006659 [Tulosesus angulatus]
MAEHDVQARDCRKTRVLGIRGLVSTDGEPGGWKRGRCVSHNMIIAVVVLVMKYKLHSGINTLRELHLSSGQRFLY